MKINLSRVTASCGLTVISLLVPSFLQAQGYGFKTINNNNDTNFNQLLGINNSGTIAGYWGDGSVVPNHGFTVTPPYGQANFSGENFPGATQTQVIGINNSGTTVGFYVDAAGNNFGFVNKGTFSTVTNPATPAGAPQVNQLLGVNDSNVAVGFYNGSASAQAYVYNIGGKTFTPVTPTGSSASTAAGINNAGDIAGFFTSSSTGNTEGFYWNGKSYSEFEAPGSTNTGFFGLNNKGLAVGYYVDAAGLSHGLVYNVNTGTFKTIDDPNASATPAFNVNGTTINGINDLGQIVGFYSDGTHVNGMLASVSPEPASLGLSAMACLLGLGVFFKSRRRQSAE